MLSPKDAVAQAKRVHEWQVPEVATLDMIRRYLKGRQRTPAVIPATAPHEVRLMARSSRVNIMPIVVNSLVQSMYVDGFRAKDTRTDLDVWNVWQRNRMDARQTGIHRATATYGAAYAVVLPGSPVPVIRAVSPRRMTAIYGEDPDWPMWALERADKKLWRLYDEEAIYYLSGDPSEVDPNAEFEFIESRVHNAGVTPVVRYLDEDDLDADDEVEPEHLSLLTREYPSRGQVAPLMALQDQIDLTTFGLQVAQHYGAFRQRYIIGWIAESEEKLMKVGASQIMTFDEDPDESGEGGMKVGEFAQTDLSGYIDSRDASLRHAAAISQTPVHELTGTLVNMAAEALVASEAGKELKVNERQTLSGESHEQTLWLAGQIGGFEVPDDAEVRWRDTSARSLAATVDALGKLASLLEVPQEELWERIPNVTAQDVERWKKARKAAPPPPPA